MTDEISYLRTFEDNEPPGIELRESDHDAHLNEEKEGFDKCWPVMVHCRSEDEAKAIARLITTAYRESEDERIWNDPWPVGATIIDCGDHGEIVAVEEHEEHGHVYDIEWEDGGSVTYPHSEIELGIVDGTIGVAP